MIRKFPKLAEMDYVGVATYGGFVDIRGLGTGKSWGKCVWHIYHSGHTQIHSRADIQQNYSVLAVESPTLLLVRLLVSLVPVLFLHQK